MMRSKRSEARWSRSEHKRFLQKLGLKLKDVKWALSGKTEQEIIRCKGQRFLSNLHIYFNVYIATGIAPDTAPDTLLCNGQSNPSDVSPTPVPYFSAIYRSSYSYATAEDYQIQVDIDPGFGDPIWDSGQTALETLCDRNSRCEDIDYGGPALSEDGTKYYWRIRFWTVTDSPGLVTEWSTEEAYFTMVLDKEAPWKEDILEPTGEVKVEIPRRSGQWTTLEDVMRIHTSNGKDPFAAVEIGQAEVTCCNISKNFNSFEAASGWYKSLEGYAAQIKLGCNIGGSPVSIKLFTGIISAVDVDRLSLTAEIKLVDFLDYFGRVTIEETPVWQNISLTQLYKNLVELAFPEWVEGTDYFVEDLGGSTIPAIGYVDLNLLSELKMIAESRGCRLYTDVDGKPHCAERNPDREPLTVSHDYNLEDVRERRNLGGIYNWIVVHARPHEIKPDLEPPGKIAGFTATPGDTKIDLSWSNPTDDDFEKVLIRFSTTAYPLNKEDGTKIYEGVGESKSHTGLTNGKKYYYSAFTKDTTGNWSGAAHTSAVAGLGGSTWEDETGPSRVSSFMATPEHSKIILTWYNPKLANFEKIVIRRSTTSYPSTPTSGSAEYDGTAETHEDTGLTNGIRYYYSAFVKNTAGDYSGAAFASAIPAGERKVIGTQKTFGGGCLEARWEGPIYGEQEVYGCPECNVLGTNYSRSVTMHFKTQGHPPSWLRFRHTWDIWVHSAYAYKSNERHESGQKDDLNLNFSQNIGGIVNITVTAISGATVYYRITYTGGKAMCVGYRNKLQLMG